MSYTTIIRIDDLSSTYVRDLTIEEAYQAAMRPDMKVGPNRWHVMMPYYARDQIAALAFGQSIDVAWQDPSPNPEEEVIRISIMRQPPPHVPALPLHMVPQYDDQQPHDDQQPDEPPRHDAKRTRTH